MLSIAITLVLIWNTVTYENIKGHWLFGMQLPAMQNAIICNLRVYVWVSMSEYLQRIELCGINFQLCSQYYEFQ